MKSVISRKALLRWLSVLCVVVGAMILFTVAFKRPPGKSLDFMMTGRLIVIVQEGISPGPAFNGHIICTGQSVGQSVGQIKPD